MEVSSCKADIFCIVKKCQGKFDCGDGDGKGYCPEEGMGILLHGVKNSLDSVSSALLVLILSAAE